MMLPKYSDNTISKFYRQLKTGFRVAQEKGMIEKNPMNDSELRRPKSSKAKQEKYNLLPCGCFPALSLLRKLFFLKNLSCRKEYGRRYNQMDQRAAQQGQRFFGSAKHGIHDHRNRFEVQRGQQIDL